MSYPRAIYVETSGRKLEFHAARNQPQIKTAAVKIQFNGGGKLLPLSFIDFFLLYRKTREMCMEVVGGHGNWNDIGTQ